MAIGEEKIKPISFRKLMQLKPLGDDVFESVTPAWPPVWPPAASTLANLRAFGGHAYAQSAWAASKTVGRGFVVHNITGHFLIAGEVNIPFVYHVHRVRDGASYSLRKVEVFQDSKVAGGGKVPCFISTVSFKRDEPSGKTLDYGHQDALPDYLLKHYESVLKDKQPEDHPIAPASDAEWFYSMATPLLNQHSHMFPGVEVRKVDMQPYNGVAVKGGGLNGEGATRWRQLSFYRMRKEGPGDLDEMNLNLHAAAHMYASDRNSLFLSQRALGYEDLVGSMGSLAHTVIFHGSSENMRMVDSRDNDKWFVQEAWTSASGENRVVHNSRLWDLNEGRIVGQTVQDGMMRIYLRDNESKL